MDTESNQSSESSDQDFSLEEERERTGLFSWDEPDNLMPPWSVPPGLLIPAPRRPEPGTGPSGPAAPQPAADDGSWPGVAPPAGWFLHAQVPSARAGSGPAVPGATNGADAELERITSEPLAPGLLDPEGRRPEAREPEPELHEPELHEPELHEPEWPAPEPDPPSTVPRAAPQPDRTSRPGPGFSPGSGPSFNPGSGSGSSPSPSLGSGTGPGSVAWLWPSAAAAAVPSPRREPDGSWSSPLTPKPAPKALGPTQARHGRPGGPGFQPARSGAPGVSQWQRSHEVWTGAGIQWEQEAPAAQAAPRPASPYPASPRPASPYPASPRPASPHPASPRPAAPPRPLAAPRPVPGRHARPDLRASERPQAYAPDEAYVPEPAASWSGRRASPLGAPVYADPDLDSDDGQARGDRWDDDRLPIRERPSNLAPPRAPGRTAGPGQRSPGRPGAAPAGRPPRRPAGGHASGDTLLLDHRMPGQQRSAPGRGGRRAATIAVPALVLVAVAVLAVALLTGHVLKLGPLSGDKHKAAAPGISSVAPQLPLAAVTLDTYPGQDQRGVVQTINRVVASGNTIVTMGSQTSDGVVRQQFLVSTNAGASWRLAPVSAPGGGQGAQSALGHPATLLAGGPGGWVAVGPHAIWTSPTGQAWTLASSRGISPQLHGDSVWVITKTAQGYLAAGSNNGGAVLWTSRNGLTWQRLTAGQAGLAGPGETVLNIAYETYQGNATLISGEVSKGKTSYSAAWLSTNGGTAWTRLAIPADHGATAAISGVAFDGSGLIAIRPGRGTTGAADGIAYFSPDGRTWQYAATIDPQGGWTPGVVKGSGYGFVVTGTTTQGQIVGYTSTGTGTAWLPTASLGSAAAESVVGATVAPAGTIVAIGYTTASPAGQQPVFVEASTSGTVHRVALAGIAGAAIPEMKINSTATSGGVQIAVGSANGYPAVWRKTAGSAWALVSSLGLVSADPKLRTLTSVTHGPAGWLAVGAPGPAVLTSADGMTWGVAGGNITQDLAGVSAVSAASGPAGYVIAGQLVAQNGSAVADVWWSANLTSWTRARDTNDAAGSSQVLAVAASPQGFVSVGSHDGQPAVWKTSDGRAWETIVLPLPAGATAGSLQQVAISGANVAALGQATTGHGPVIGSATGTVPGAIPFAELSADGGQTWQQVPFSTPGPDTSFTALTADQDGFTAAGLFGPAGQQDVALWTSADGVTWKPSQSSGLNGSEAWQIDALAPSGSGVAGVGTIVTQQSQQTVTFTLPPPSK
jgi:hypothetical protein